MEKAELKIIGSKVLQGFFEELLDVLNNRPDSLTPKQALYLIVCCCTTCNTNINSCDKLNEQKLISAVKCLSKNITKLTNEEYDSYLQSIFFICKLLMKKNVELLLELKDEILPSFKPKILTERQQNLYRSICDLIRNEVVEVTLKNVDVDKEKITLIGNLLSETIISSNHAIFLDYVFKYALCLQRLNVDLGVQFRYFSHNITVMKDLSPENILNGILQLLKYAIHLFLLYLKDGKLDNAQKCIYDTLNVVPKEGEWRDLKEILNICGYIIDPNSNKDDLVISKDCLVKSFKLYRKSENFLSTCKLLSQTIVTYSNFCKNYDEKGIHADPEKHLILYEISSVMSEILTPSHEACIKGCKCLSKSNFEGSDAALCILMLFSSLLASANIDIEYTRKVRKFLKKYFEFLVHRRNHKCEVYKKYWTDAAPYLYNVGVLLLRKENFEEAASFGKMTLKYNSLLSEGESVVLSSTFNLLNSAYLKQKNYKEAMIWLAIEIFNTNKSCRNKVFYKWIRTKAECREVCELQEFTILSIIDVIPREFTHYIGQIKTKDEIDLLVCELENYYVRWKSKISMMSAFRHLCKIADKFTIMKVFVQLFTDEDTVVHENVPKLLNDIFQEFEKCPETLDKSLKLYLSFYLFFKYKHQTVDLILKNLEEMEKVAKPKNSADIDIIPPDAFDRCDTVSVYDNLKVNEKKLKYLTEALTVLEGIVVTDLNRSSFQEIDPKKVYELAKNIAIEFISNSDGYNTLRSLYLTFSIAQFLDDKVLLLESSGYFVRYLNFSQLEDAMENTINCLKNSEQSYKYLLHYYMNLSYFHVSVKNIEAAYEYYNSAKKYWEYLVENEKNLWCIEISMELLLFKLMDVAKSMQFKKMKMTFSYGPLIKAYDMIVNKYTTGSQWSTYSMMILLDILDTLTKMYYDLKMPREVRCFGKQCLNLTQQHVLPVYSSKILSYLAHADIWGEKWDDCRVKLDGIADILLLNKTERCSKIPKLKTHLTVPSVNDIMEGIQEIMLDVPFQPAYSIKSAPSSPALQVQSYICPFFMKHLLCKCFHCTSVVCQQVVLSYYHLEAVWYMHKGQKTLADSFFRGVFKLHESLSNKRLDMLEILNRCVSQHSDFFQNLPKKGCETDYSLNEIKIYTSINYIKFMVASGARESAKKFCENALKKFRTAKVHHPHLYAEMLLLKIGLIYKPEVSTEGVGVTQVENTANDDSNTKVRTPEPCVPKVALAKINSPRIKKFLPPKVIKFNLTDLNATPSKKTSDSAVPKTPKIKVLPPSLRIIHTPNLKSPARKSIFSEDSKIPTSSENCKNNASDLNEKQKSPLSEILPTVNSKQSATDLEQKTRLLTSRLRKKQDSENNSTPSNKVVKETDVQPVRRSKRNRT